MDKFPEAFSRFEKIMHVEKVENFHQLEMMFGEWAGHKWIPTSRQAEALRREAERHGILARHRFSAKYGSYSFWMARRHTSSYERRITSYLSTHPHATLREARGHRKK